MNEAILFSEWIGENNYKMIRLDEGVRYWKKQVIGSRKVISTFELYKMFKNESGRKQMATSNCSIKK